MVKLLESGYWHVRLGPQMFFQWPRGRDPELSDGFPVGFVDEQDLARVVRMVAESGP